MAKLLTFKRRFELFLGRLMQGGAVPFLGAGVSQGARSPNNTSFRPTVPWMRDALASELGRYLEAQWDTHRERCRLVLGTLEVQWQEGKDFPWLNFRGACNRSQFGHLTEVASWVMRHNQVCDAIGIKHLTELKPLPAHRYLAYLAREGLLTEIITTNFDTCIEKAFCQTFSQREPPSCLAVVTSLEEYRQYGGRLVASGDRYRRPVLKLYKINGCATQMQGDGGNADSIILTERQLHNFSDERQWTAHLFCDRARARSLVFSGFGSDEPQIRHTILTLLEEFSRQAKPPDGGDVPLCSLPNAPWITAYEAELSYSQLQVLYAFQRAHKKEPGLEDCKQHTFTGREAHHFCPERNEAKLPADLFWQRVFQSIYLGSCGSTLMKVAGSIPGCVQ